MSEHHKQNVKLVSPDEWMTRTTRKKDKRCTVMYPKSTSGPFPMHIRTYPHWEETSVTIADQLPGPKSEFERAARDKYIAKLRARELRAAQWHLARGWCFHVIPKRERNQEPIQFCDSDVKRATSGKILSMGIGPKL
jgi:hypothetical protein